MAKWLGIQEEINQLFDKINSLEERAVRDLLNSADVVCSTNSTAGSELLEGWEFELVVIDEATQATEPGALIPLIKAQKAVFNWRPQTITSDCLESKSG